MDKSNSQIKSLLEEIKNNSDKKVLVYALDGCPACVELKNKLDKVGVVFETIGMGGNQVMWDKLAKMGGSEYAPQVKVDGYLIKENEYNDINQLISCTLTNLLNRKIVIK
jgi:glutaredoxin